MGEVDQRALDHRTCPGERIAACSSSHQPALAPASTTTTRNQYHRATSASGAGYLRTFNFGGSGSETRWVSISSLPGTFPEPLMTDRELALVLPTDFERVGDWEGAPSKT